MMKETILGKANGIGCVVNTDECSKNEPVTTDSKHLISNKTYP